VAKVGRLERGGATAGKGSLSTQPSVSSVLQGGDSIVEQLTLQVAALQKQQEDLQTVCTQSPTVEQVKALEQQVKELQQQQGPQQAGAPAGKDTSASSKQLADLTRRMNSTEEALTQMKALYASKSPEGYVPRGEMMRAFNTLNDNLTTKIKRVGDACQAYPARCICCCVHWSVGRTLVCRIECLFSWAVRDASV